MTLEILPRVNTDAQMDAYIWLRNSEVYVKTRSGSLTEWLWQVAELPFSIADESWQAPVISLGKFQARNVGLLLDRIDQGQPKAAELCTGRSLLSMLQEPASALLSRALQLAFWLSSHRYCGRCATRTDLSGEDIALVCPNCALRSYPRISPCVIGLVTRGDEVLLAHGVNHPEGLYSAIAGFIEAGENAEQAFAREVKEEVGVEVCAPSYVKSQVWPFPSQLMLGYIAELKSGTVRPDQEEILDAQWFRYDALPEHPPSFTIAGKLIEHWKSNLS